MTSKPRKQAVHATVVSDNLETLRDLQAYFDASGIPTHATRALRETPSADTTAMVLFPDDYVVDEVNAMLAALQAERPRLLVVLVTRSPQLFEHQPDGRSRPPIVLPKPSFGWSILDAIRANADA